MTGGRQRFVVIDILNPEDVSNVGVVDNDGAYSDE